MARGTDTRWDQSRRPRFILEEERDLDWEYDRESGKASRPSEPRPLPGAYRNR